MLCMYWPIGKVGCALSMYVSMHGIFDLICGHKRKKNIFDRHDFTIMFTTHTSIQLLFGEKIPEEKWS